MRAKELVQRWALVGIVRFVRNSHPVSWCLTIRAVTSALDSSAVKAEIRN